MSTEKQKIIFEGDSRSAQKSIDDLEKKLNQLNSKLNKVSSDTNKAGKKMEGSFKGLGTAIKGLLPLLSAGALIGFANNAIKVSDSIDKTSKSLGLTTKGFQELNFAASQSSVNQELLSISLKAIQNRSQLATNGLNEYRKNFIKLNIDVNEFNKLSLPDKMRVLAERLNKVKDPGEKVAIAVSLLGDSGRKLLPLLDGGAAGFDKMAQQAEKLGIIIDEKTIAANVKLGDSIDKSTKAMSASFASLTASVAPELTFLLDVTTSAFNDIGKAIKGIALIITTALIGAVDLVLKAFANLFELADKIPLVGDKFKGLAETVRQYEKNTSFAFKSGLKSLGDLTVGVNENKGAVDKLNKSSEKYKEATKGVIKTQEELNKVFKKPKNANGATDKSSNDLADAGRNIADVLLGNTSPALKAFNDKMLKLNEALKAGVINQSEFSAASKKLKLDFDALNTVSGRRLANLKELAKGAAQEMQGNFENFFFNAMHGNFGNLINDFTNTIDKMVSKALAADLANALGFGSESSSGGIFGSILGATGGGGSNIFGSIASGIGSIFGGGFASGGDVQAGRRILVGENGPEFFTPGSNGAIQNNTSNNSNSNVTVNMNITTNDADSFRKSQAQITAETAIAINRAQARNL